MASNAIKGLTIEIGGDTTKLGDAIKDAEAQSRSLSKELGEINRLLKMDPGNADLLAQKQKVLAEAVEATAKKLDTLKEAEKQVQAQFERGEVSEEQVRALQREIVATENKLKGYKKAVDETAKETDDLGDEAEETEKDVDELGDEAEDAGEELEEAGDKASSFGDKVKKAAGLAVKGLAAVGAAAGAATAALTDMTVDAAAYADEILTMSTVTGVSTEKLQEFKYASELVDVSVETMTKSMAKNVKSMDSAAKGSKAYADAYKKLGVSVTDSNGNLRDSETVYWECIDALGAIENETERDALAMQLFGKSAQELNPLIEAGSERMNELAKEAHEAGAVLSEDALNAFGAFDDSLQRLTAGAGAAKNALGTVLLPELQLLADTGVGFLNDFTSQLNASGGGMEGFIATLSNMAPQIGETLGGLATHLMDTVVQMAPALVEVAMALVTTLTTALISMLPQFITAGVQIITTILNGLSTAIPQLVEAIVTMIPQLVEALMTGIPQILQGAVQLFLAVVQAIPRIIPPLIAAIPQIIITVVNALIQALPQVLQGAVQMLTALIKAIPQILPPFVAALPKIINAVVDFFSANINTILDAAIELLMAVVEALPTIIKALTGALPQIINTIINFLINNIDVLVQAAITMFMAIIQALPTICDALVTNMPQIISTIINGLIQAVPKIFSAALDLGAGIVKGLWEGIKNLGSWLWDKLTGWAGDIVGWVGGLFGIHSPSRVFRDQIGKNLGLGVAEGIEDSLPDVQDAMNDLGDVALNGPTLERSLQHNSTQRAAAEAAAQTVEYASKLDRILAAIEKGQILTIDGRLFVGGTAENYDNAMGERQLLAARGVI